MRGAVLILLLGGALLGCALLGCGRLEFDPRVDAARAGDDAADPSDADVFPACDPTAPFGAPIAISELNTPVHEGTLRLLPDELSGYLWRGPTGARDLMLATRASPSAPFIATNVQGLDMTDELDPTITSDGSLLVFRRSQPGNSLHTATRIAPDQFGASTPITAINTNQETQPFLPVGGNELYFQRLSSGNGDVFRATRMGTTFGAPTLVSELATADEEGDPMVSPDGLAIYFRSNRVTLDPGFNIYVATRATTADSFGAPGYVPSINTAADDGPSWISPDGCRLYISSDIAGTNDIYVATRGM